MATTEGAGIDFRQVLAVLRRHLLVIVVLTLALGAAGYAYASSQTSMYEATATLLYEPQLDVTNSLNSSSGWSTIDQERLMQNAVTIIGGPELGGLVADKLPRSAKDTPYSVSATLGSSDAESGSGVGNTLTISVTSSDPQVAADVANAYATQFIAYRVEKDRARIATAQQVVSQKLADYQTDAEKASSDYVMLSEYLRDLEVLSATATGNFEMAIPASTPSAPYASRSRRGRRSWPPPWASSSASATPCCARSSTRGCAATARSAS